MTQQEEQATQAAWKTGEGTIYFLFNFIHMISYLLKANVVITVVYLLYYVMLKKLTFYRWNRIFFLLFSFVAFTAPLINTTSIVKDESTNSSVLSWVPAIENTKTFIVKKEESVSTIVQQTGYEWTMAIPYIYYSVFIFLLLKIIWQIVSLYNLRKRAVFLSTIDNIRIYTLPEIGVPFSFGNNVFISRSQHTPVDTNNVLLHEMAHARQGHSFDIILGELLCSINWFNPFMWLLKNAMRQNLEFIADNAVLHTGASKKDYQYLLLTVTGIQPGNIVNGFNFSNIKKRIFMMNKNKSAKVNLIRFLLILPLFAVLLLSFRHINKDEKKVFGNNANTYPVAGYVLDAETNKGIAEVTVVETNTGIKAIADAEGYYNLPIPDSVRTLKIEYRKPGRKLLTANMVYGDGPSEKTMHKLHLIFGGMISGQQVQAQEFTHSTAVPINNGSDEAETKTRVTLELANFKKYNAEVKLLDQMAKGNEKLYFEVSGSSYMLANGMRLSLTPVTDVVFVNGKKKTGNEINQLYKRSEVLSVSMLNENEVLKKHGLHVQAFQLSIKK